MGSTEGTTMLPFSDAVDAPNEDCVNVCDSDPPPTAKKTVDMPLSPSETPHWSIFSEVVTYPASPSPGLEITPIQSECCDMGKNDTIGKIELNPSFVLSSNRTNCKNDIQ